MEDFFAKLRDAQWDRQQRLHVYVTPTDELRGLVAEQQALLGDNPGADYGLGLVPPRWLHFTVQMLTASEPELDARQLSDLGSELARRLAPVEPFDLHVGPPQVSRHAVELTINPAADSRWRHLVETVRDVARDTLGEDVLPEPGPNVVPHTSIAYGIGDGDSGAAMSALKRHRPRIVTVPVTEVHLVAVTQHPTEGYFSWEHVSRAQLQGSVEPGRPRPVPQPATPTDGVPHDIPPGMLPRLPDYPDT